MLCENVKSYLANSKGLPFFYVVGDEDYKEILSEFTQSGVIIDRVSDFCPKDDKYPDIDDIIDHFRTLDMDYRQNKHVLIGLGEYLALRGAEITEKVLRRLKNTTLGTARVIILLRCVTPQINNLATEDGRIAEQKRLLVGENAISSLNVTCVKYFAQDNVALGIKNLLHDMEDCCGGKKYVKSDLDFSNSLIPVTYIHTAFSAVKQVASNSELAENMGTEAQWDRFFQELSKSEGSLDALFLKYGYEDEYEEDIYEKCAGFEFKNWIFFVFLKQKCKHIQNTYLKYVVSHTNYYEDLKNNLLTAIVGISRIDPRYGTFYSERKKLIKDFPESEVAIFIRENSVDPTPQGGIISPLLANIVLNELDWWIASQWEENPIAISRGRERIIGKTKVFDKSHGYRIMKNTEMKEMHIIRYADDFRIFCRTKEDAVRTKEAVTAWIEERLKLEVSPEKTRIVNTRKRWSEFLGFKIRVRLKHHKYVVQSAICDKKVEIERAKLVEQAKNIAKPREKKSCLSEIQLYNSMVLGIQNYYQLATCISIDCREFHRRVMTVLMNRLNTETGSMLKHEGGTITQAEKERFGQSKMIRYVSGIDQMIYPIAFIKNKIPMAKRSIVCSYTKEGRAPIHTELNLNQYVLKGLREKISVGHSTEYHDSKISLFSAQKGKCAISGEEFADAEHVAVWLKVPRALGGFERYKNMVLIHKKYLILLQELPQAVIKDLIKTLNITKKMLVKINSLREQANLSAII